MGKITKSMRWEVIKKTLFPLMVLAGVISCYIFYRVKIVPLINDDLQQQFRKYIITIFAVSIVFLIQRVIGTIFIWYKDNIAIKTKSRLDDELIPFFTRVSKIAVWVVAFIIILPLYGFNMTALITTLGVSSLAIALAAQDTIANIISGFLIMVDRPFRIGDRIKLPSGEIVEVLNMGIRRSTFLSEDKAVIIVPNLDLSKSRIINYTYGVERQQKKQ